MRNLLFVINEPGDLGATQTTTLLIAAASRRHDLRVLLCGVADLALTDDGSVETLARAVGRDAEAGALSGGLALGAAERLALDPHEDLVLVRTNPARDQDRAWAHDVALQILAFGADRGLRVLNDPTGLRRATSKLYLSRMPASCRPATLVSNDVERLRAFVEQAGGPTVLKPLQGTRGQDVFKIDGPQTPNLNQILDVLTRRGFAMAQSFVPQASQGDVRLVLLGGRLLEADGKLAAVRRVPPALGGDFRSNVHIGGTPVAVEVDDTMRRVVAEVGPRLVRDGIVLAGLDLIGDRIVEINVFSTGGLWDAERFYDAPFIDVALQGLLQLAHAPLAGD